MHIQEHKIQLTKRLIKKKKKKRIEKNKAPSAFNLYLTG